MPRIRTIKPAFFSDAKMNSLSIEAQLLYIGLWVFADDDGLLWDDSDQIRMDIFPGRPHIKIQPLLEELLLSGQVVPLETTLSTTLSTGGKHALWIKNLGTHQRIDHPSVSVIAPLLLFPPAESRGVVPECKGREGKGKEGKETTSSPAAQDDRWEAFWKLYPPRNGKKLDKAKAITEFSRLNDEHRNAALTGVEHYRNACDLGTLPKDAFRWLRDHCFDDWQEPAVMQPTLAGSGHRPEPPVGAGRRRGWDISSGQTYNQYIRGEYPDGRS